MSEPVAVRILEREYLVGCLPEEREGLMDAARLLDARMREIRGDNRMAGIDRIAVLAALNLAHELTTLRRDNQRGTLDIENMLARIDVRLDALDAPPPPEP